MKVAITVLSIRAQNERLGEAKLVAAFVICFMISVDVFKSLSDDSISNLI